MKDIQTRILAKVRLEINGADLSNEGHRRNMCSARNSIFYNGAKNLCSREYNGNYEGDANNAGLMKNITRNVLKKLLC